MGGSFLKSSLGIWNIRKSVQSYGMRLPRQIRLIVSNKVNFGIDFRQLHEMPSSPGGADFLARSIGKNVEEVILRRGDCIDWMLIFEKVGTLCGITVSECE